MLLALQNVRGGTIGAAVVVTVCGRDRAMTVTAVAAAVIDVLVVCAVGAVMLVVLGGSEGCRPISHKLSMADLT